ncbi:GTP-binding protein, partial [candidate division GN15 bacterium]|nr:GTP-binding protein [candidate division GN15 bacterium]
MAGGPGSLGPLLMRVKPDTQQITCDIKIALCGNPNCGKTTIFNAITGLRQKVANYPGVTVEKTVGSFRVPEHPNHRFTLVDIPGTYSLAAFSPDEYVAVRALCGNFEGEDAPDAIVAIVDVTNLERSLYFLFQVLQVERPVIVALNMMDVAERRGMQIDTRKLSKLLGGVPVVPLVGSRGIGIDELKRQLVATAEKPVLADVKPYDDAAERALAELREASNGYRGTRSEYLRVLFDKDGPAEKSFIEHEGEDKRALLDRLRSKLIDAHGSLSAAETAPLTRLAGDFYEQVVTHKSDKRRATSAERIDRLLLHPVFGPIVFLTLMVLVFQAIFSWAAPFMDLIDGAFGALAGLIEGAMAEGPLRSLLVDGIVGGVGSVLIFLPQIIILFIFV